MPFIDAEGAAHRFIDASVTALEFAAAVVIVVAGATAFWRFLRTGPAKPHERERTRFARALLLALDFAIGADILRVARDRTLVSVGTVGLVVLVRIALTLVLEYELRRADRHAAKE